MPSQVPTVPSCLAEQQGRHKRQGGNRQKQRRAADQAIRDNTAKREDLDPEAVQALFKAIDENNNNPFGIRHLAYIELDTLHPSPEYLAWEPEVTLITYAAWRQRYKIVKCLFRAGANPSVRWHGGSEDTAVGAGGATSTVATQECDKESVPRSTEGQSTALKALEGVPSAYVMWVLCTLSRMRLAGRIAVSRMQSEKATPADLCPCCQGSVAAQPVGWPCGHICCETCFWGSAAKLLGQDEELRCLNCNGPIVSEEEGQQEAMRIAMGKGSSSCKQQKKAKDQRRQAKRIGDAELKANGHPEDWTCSACRYSNFSYRNTCRSCGTSDNASFQVWEKGAAASPEHNAAIAAPAGGHHRKSAVKAYRSTLASLSRKGVCFFAAAAAAVAAGTAALLLRESRANKSGRVGFLLAATLPLAGSAVALLSARGEQESFAEAEPKLQQGREHPRTPSELRVASKELWDRLPSEADEGPADPETQKQKKKEAEARREKFQALPLAAAAATFLGHTREKRTAELHGAAITGNVRRLRALLTAGVDIEAVNEYGQSALFLAAQQGHAQAVVFLSDNGANVDRAAHGGSRPLTAAAAMEHTEAVAALLANGCDLSLPGSHGVSALEHAVARGHSKVSCALRQHLGDDKSVKQAASNGINHEAISRPLEPIDRVVTVLIDPSSSHVGAGSFMVDNAFPEALLCRIESLWNSLPVAEKKGSSGSDHIIHRSYFCDAEGWIQEAVAAALSGTGRLGALDCIRFLHYFTPGGMLPPHIDLSKTSASGIRSTHTLLVYLADCTQGGETVLLESLEPGSRELGAVRPRRGCMLIFPHNCPHKAEPVVEVPKVVLRGECY